MKFYWKVFMKLSLKRLLKIKPIFLILILSLILFVFLLEYFNRPYVKSTVKLQGTKLCMTHIMSASDSHSDVPPYGEMVFIDDKGCVAHTLFRKRYAKQIFGGYCQDLVMEWQSNKAAKISCRNGSNDWDKNVVLKVDKFKDINISFEFVGP